MLNAVFPAFKFCICCCIVTKVAIICCFSASCFSFFALARFLAWEAGLPSEPSSEQPRRSIKHSMFLTLVMLMKGVDKVRCKFVSQTQDWNPMRFMDCKSRSQCYRSPKIRFSSQIFGFNQKHGKVKQFVIQVQLTWDNSISLLIQYSLVIFVGKTRLSSDTYKMK